MQNFQLPFDTIGKHLEHNGSIISDQFIFQSKKKIFLLIFMHWSSTSERNNDQCINMIHI